jgi:folate-dependent phosphoribosylglycinamide formyltransferase PurN
MKNEESNPFEAAVKRVSQGVPVSPHNEAEALRARVQQLEAEVRALRQMIEGATIACVSGGVTLTWG